MARFECEIGYWPNTKIQLGNSPTMDEVKLNLQRRFECFDLVLDQLRFDRKAFEEAQSLHQRAFMFRRLSRMTFSLTMAAGLIFLVGQFPWFHFLLIPLAAFGALHVAFSTNVGLRDQKLSQVGPRLGYFTSGGFFYLHLNLWNRYAKSIERHFRIKGSTPDGEKVHDPAWWSILWSLAGGEIRLSDLQAVNLDTADDLTALIYINRKFGASDQIRATVDEKIKKLRENFKSFDDLEAILLLQNAFGITDIRYRAPKWSKRDPQVEADLLKERCDFGIQASSSKQSEAA